MSNPKSHPKTTGTIRKAIPLRTPTGITCYCSGQGVLSPRPRYVLLPQRLGPVLASPLVCLPWETSGGAGGLTGLERGLDGGHGARGWLRRNLTAQWRQQMTARPGRRR